ncbi:unnamed protein product, partial [Porites evermanni]
LQNSPAEVFLDHAKLEKEKERLCWQGAKSFDRESHPARKTSFKGLGKITMNLRVLLAFLLLAMLTTEVHSWWGRRRRSTRPPPRPSTGGRRERNDRRYGGPTPRGEYLIGNRYTNPRYNIDWYNLYPKKEDNSGYYGYTQRTKLQASF